MYLAPHGPARLDDLVCHEGASAPSFVRRPARETFIAARSHSSFGLATIARVAFVLCICFSSATAFGQNFRYASKPRADADEVMLRNPIRLRG